MFAININPTSVHVIDGFFVSDHRVVVSDIHSPNTISLNSKAPTMCQGRQLSTMWFIMLTEANILLRES